MTDNKRVAATFTHRLADTIQGDESDPQVIICDDSHYELAEDGRVVREASGAEAVLIIRGPEEGRRNAIEHLIALLRK